MDKQVNSMDLINQMKLNFASELANKEQTIALLQVQNEMQKNELESLKTNDKGASQDGKNA